MPTVYSETSDETLSAASLQQYVSADPKSINAPGPNGETPLMAAVLKGNLSIARLLLINKTGQKADPKISLPDGRTALFLATTESPKKDRAAIVQTLLEQGANKDEVYPQFGGMTPLMNALTEVQDEAVVRVLVDAGANQDSANTKGDTAKTLAKEVGMESSLVPKSQRGSTLASIVDLLTTFVKFVIIYSGAGIITDAVGDLAKKLFKYNEPPNPELEAKLNAPKKVADFTKAADSYVKDSGLDKFFPPGDPYIKTLAQNAANLKDEDQHLNTPENIKRLTYLSLYQLVIYCDDSGSMEDGTRWADQRTIAERITRVASKILPPDLGVELRLINQDPPKTGILTADEVKDALTTLKPNGGTPIGTSLQKKVLKPLVYDLIASNTFKRPVLICTITDGCPNMEDNDTYKKQILDCMDKLNAGKFDTSSVMYSISRVANDPGAIEFLKDLEGQHQIEDVLYCTADEALDDTFSKMRDNDQGFEIWLLKMLTAPLLRDN